MSNPPRRSRPKRPNRTIDLKAERSGAERSGAVGYPGPVSREDAADPEARLDEAASLAGPTAEISAPPAPEADGSEATLRDFAEDEGLAHSEGRERPAEEFEDETILAAAVPDPSASEGTPGSSAPRPSYDYHTTSALTQPDPRGSGFSTALVAGLVGALLALAGGGLLQYAGVLPSFGRQDPAELSQQFASIGDVQQVTADFTTLREDVERLKSAQAAGGAGAGATSADLNAVADRVTAIEQRASQASAAPSGPAFDPAAVEAVRQAADEAKGLATDAKALSTDAKGLATDAKGLATEAKQTADAARQGADAATGAVAGIKRTADDANAASSSARQTADNAIQAAATAQQTATTAQGAATSAQGAASAAQQTANAATEGVGRMEPRVSAIEASSRQAATAIAAASLKSAIDQGEPFMAPLERFAKVAGPSPAVETLRGFAAAGVPSKASLASAWPPVEEAIRAALRPAPPEGDVGRQVISGLSALVTVRQATPAPAAAEGSEAAVSRLAGAIASGDLAGFLAEWDKLPDAGKQASADFQARVKARAETEKVVGDSLNTAVEAAGTAG